MYTLAIQGKTNVIVLCLKEVEFVPESVNALTLQCKRMSHEGADCIYNYIMYWFVCCNFM